MIFLNLFGHILKNIKHYLKIVYSNVITRIIRCVIKSM